jgi:hypothetical protein
LLKRGLRNLTPKRNEKSRESLSNKSFLSADHKFSVNVKLESTPLSGNGQGTKKKQFEALTPVQYRATSHRNIRNIVQRDQIRNLKSSVNLGKGRANPLKNYSSFGRQGENLSRSNNESDGSNMEVLIEGIHRNNEATPATSRRRKSSEHLPYSDVKTSTPMTREGMNKTMIEFRRNQELQAEPTNTLTKIFMSSDSFPDQPNAKGQMRESRYYKNKPKSDDPMDPKKHFPPTPSTVAKKYQNTPYSNARDSKANIPDPVTATPINRAKYDRTPQNLRKTAYQNSQGKLYENAQETQSSTQSSSNYSTSNKNQSVHHHPQMFNRTVNYAQQPQTQAQAPQVIQTPPPAEIDPLLLQRDKDYTYDGVRVAYLKRIKNGQYAGPPGYSDYIKDVAVQAKCARDLKQLCPQGIARLATPVTFPSKPSISFFDF